MSPGLIRAQSPIEYFKELVDDALAHQRLQAEELTACYVVNLLAGYVKFDPATEGRAIPILDGEPLALQLIRALESVGRTQRDGLRQVGDVSLFVSGFFSDSLNRRVVDVDYYIAVGGFAYDSLSRCEHASVGRIFAELAEKFVGFVDVIGEVSDRSGISSNADIMRLYETWLRTGSRRSGRKLVERGIIPNASLSQRLFQ